MALIDSISLASKFRGCLLGSLLGDCLGAPFEGDVEISKSVLQNYFDKLEGPYFKSPVKQYTDDAAMTKCLAESLITRGKFDALDVAKRFVKEYFNEPRRGYGQNVIDVFHKLRGRKFDDPFGPAREQFDGTGSFGNGGAMRVAPLALFSHANYDELVNVVRRSAELTHTHKLGYDGTILQAIAIQQSLHLNPKENLDVQDFASKLMQKMAQIEKDTEGLGLDDPCPYQTQLKSMQILLDKKDEAHDEEVERTLGNSVAALYSVPTAIFCFLRACSPIPEIKTNNPFRRTIQYAISLGGDTDTIANMAGAIAGAYYGECMISENVRKHCEAADQFVEYADKLHKIACK
ncbi:ADP-ribosylhydrolase ARH3-like [Periplaneta americana]|uniref:ADP-ribosylhydrolase ARH3-like n=1 Tax=Periplaneta americana TaxID=6978 RepID=UPI0037E7A9B0